uniref:Uncharacterized protein n=1 Tax=Neobodo designis TaxID=312471 RepID=A0A7S1LKI1_NEODS|mmetsp:Transcript_24/g.77  ORF Transcript_24/g.77 Transcript_24/m.77 type:complete len:247 (+) Transcript_24:131-871(+)
MGCASSSPTDDAPRGKAAQSASPQTPPTIALVGAPDGLRTPSSRRGSTSSGSGVARALSAKDVLRSRRLSRQRRASAYATLTSPTSATGSGSFSFSGSDSGGGITSPSRVAPEERQRHAMRRGISRRSSPMVTPVGGGLPHVPEDTGLPDRPPTESKPYRALNVSAGSLLRPVSADVSRSTSARLTQPQLSSSTLIDVYAWIESTEACDPTGAADEAPPLPVDALHSSSSSRRNSDADGRKFSANL